LLQSIHATSSLITLINGDEFFFWRTKEMKKECFKAERIEGGLFRKKTTHYYYLAFDKHTNLSFFPGPVKEAMNESREKYRRDERRAAKKKKNFVCEFWSCASIRI
jgi:hypothetical protein